MVARDMKPCDRARAAEVRRFRRSSALRISALERISEVISSVPKARSSLTVCFAYLIYHTLYPIYDCGHLLAGSPAHDASASERTSHLSELKQQIDQFLRTSSGAVRQATSTQFLGSESRTS